MSYIGNRISLIVTGICWFAFWKSRGI